MITILKEVIRRRNELKTYKFDDYIQLSSCLMEKAIEELNSTLPDEVKYKQDKTMNEFKLVDESGNEWLIRNRAYRDDTNDEDVEEVLYEFYIKSLKK